jgi:hypothetical protein
MNLRRILDRLQQSELDAIGRRVDHSMAKGKHFESNQDCSPVENQGDRAFASSNDRTT